MFKIAGIFGYINSADIDWFTPVDIIFKLKLNAFTFINISCDFWYKCDCEYNNLSL